MGETAQVNSIDALKNLYEGVVLFREDAKNSLISVEMECRRATDFLSHQRVYWAEELKRRKEKLAMAQSELHKKKLQAKPGGAVQDSDQKEAVRIATTRVREAEEKIETVKKWVAPLQHAIDEYHGKSRPLGDLLEGDVEKGLGKLERMIIALEDYVRMAPPDTSGI
jgi:DNA mismatch repair ATPase MutS